MRSYDRHDGMNDAEIKRLLILECSAFQQIRLAAALTFGSPPHKFATELASEMQNEARSLRAVLDAERALERSRTHNTPYLRIIASAKHGVV